MTNLVILVEATGKSQPGKGPLDDPSFWQDDEIAGGGAFDDFNGPGKHCRCPVDQFAAMAAIGKDFPEQRNLAEQADEHRPGTDPILNTGRMDDDRQDKSQRIYGDMLLSPFGFLACVVTALPPFPALLIERESMMATEGFL